MPDVTSSGPPASPEDLFAGTKYRTVRRLAAGGMAEVFLVLHAELGREFVIKLLLQRFAGDPQLLDRVRIEAQAMGRLAHPHIVAVVDYGVTRDGRPFIVMERLVGRTLAAELGERGMVTPREALGLVLQLLTALETVHEAGFVHRDIKPENLFVTVDSDGDPMLKLLDFGIARVLPGFEDAGPLPLAVPTGTGLVVGTPRFVSPEGALGKKVDPRADVYAAGLILYLLLAGRGPFDHFHGEAQILGAHVHVQPAPPSTGVESPPNTIPWPVALDEIVLCALHKDPNARFQSARQFRDALDELIDRLVARMKARLVAEGPVITSSAQPEPGEDRQPNVEASSFPTGLLHIPMSNSILWELLLYAAVAAVTAVAASQLVRVILTY